MFPLVSSHFNAFFVRVQIDQALFIPIKQVVAAFRLRLGHIFHQQFNALMPTERFYLGGSQSLRSYQTDSAPPQGLYIDERGEHHLVPRGGKSMFNVNVELRFPVPIIKNFGVVLFQDMGALSGDMLSDFKATNLLHATGFGLRYDTPLGPLRFDIGWKWRKQDHKESAYAWFLTFGQAF
jgi:outer membrane protein assembly factor BamA